MAWGQGYQSGFDDFSGGSTHDWYVSGLWAIDASPAGAPGGPVHAGTGSLNYNNKLGNFDTGLPNSGLAHSPVINLTHLKTPALTFWCNYATQTTGKLKDKRWVQITSPGGSQFLKVQLSSAYSAAGPCPAMGVWHSHLLPLPTAWGRIKVGFKFDSVDHLSNGTAGWFIDDVRVASSEVAGMQTRYSTLFDAGEGWTLGGLWKVDATPGNAPGSPAIGATSLNYNDGVDYDTGTMNYGEALSPPVNVNGWSALATFWCNYTTQTSGTGKDVRQVRIRRTADNVVVRQYTLAQWGASPGVNPCSGMGNWHKHKIAIDPTLGSVRVGFYFNSITASDNGFPGWFVDSLKVSAANSGPVFLTSSYVTSFEDATSTAGWELTGLWKMDGTPGTLANSSPNSWDHEPSYSGDKSLNYNNGTNYSTGQANSGTARSPLIDVAHLQTPQISFRCTFSTDTDGTATDRRIVRLKDPFGAVVEEHDLAVTGGSIEAGPCTKGAWHSHTIEFSATLTKLRIEFAFDTVTAGDNGHQGWFVDDVIFDTSDLILVRGLVLQDSIYITQSSGKKLLKFGTITGNIGFGPVTADKQDFALEESDDHNHLHLNDFAEYRLIDSSGNVIVGTKQGFCLANTDKIRMDAPATNGYPLYGIMSCAVIVPGYADDYPSSLSGQEIDLTGVPDGTYTLEMVLDPKKGLVESDEQNNYGSTIKVVIQGNLATVAPALNP